LLEYYANEGKNDAVFIELPKGRYKPVVAFRNADANKAADFKQEIKFCRTFDGVALAYAMSGQGMPLVKASNWLTHLEFDIQSPVWRHWWHGLSRRHRLIRYDPRGCGLSDWEVSEISFEALVRDLECVADHAAPEKFALFGTSQGVPVAIAYAVRHPERVSHLILYGGAARGSLKRGDTEREDTHRLLQDIIRVGWGQPHGAFRHVFGAMFMPEGTSEQFRWFDELSRISMSPGNAVRMRHCIAEVNIESCLRDVKAPTLILHAADEILVPFSEARLLAANIPAARLVPLDSKNHLILEHEPAWAKFLDEVEAFTNAVG
jgi:pimeloyl-ACP methyl ester carboxylesterase